MNNRRNLAGLLFATGRFNRDNRGQRGHRLPRQRSPDVGYDLNWYTPGGGGTPTPPSSGPPRADGTGWNGMERDGTPHQ